MDRIKHIIFDWDGVIADSFELQHQFFKLVAKRFNKTYKCKNTEELRQWYKEPFRLMYEAIGLDWEKDFEQLSAFWHEYNNSIHVPLFTDMPYIIKSLYEKGYTLSIVSSNTQPVIEKWLKEHNLTSYFSHILTWHQNMTLQPKPAPDLLLLCMKRLNADNKECIYIGDQRFDVQTAKNANMKSIAVTWGYGHMTHLVAEEPDCIISLPEELLELFT